MATLPRTPEQPPPGTHTRRLSILRLLVVVLVAIALAAAGSRWALARYSDWTAAPADTWFAPYVDATLTPEFHFEDPSAAPARDVVLGFVVADPADGCAASWGTYYSLDAAARALDLDRRIVRLKERGGQAIVSFGGAANSELATSCTDPAKLAAAYQSVIDRYGLSTIDFDIEGAAIADSAANARRAAALKELQQRNRGLAVWLTLPVTPLGLSEDAVGLVDQVLGAGVDLSGVNAMTMDFGGSRPSSMSMANAGISALNASFQQLDGAYRRAGTTLGQAAIWKKLGTTPMIGQNDVAAEVFTAADARRLTDFAASVHLGRLSFWSANRDVACGAAVADSLASNTCSGVGQHPLDFTRIFLAGSTTAPAELSPTPTVQAGASVLTRDDPRTSPYPIWRPAKAYEADAKVVWQGRVYQAKWWTQGDQPDAPVKQVWETPWRYLGPVLESDRAAVQADAPTVDGVNLHWSPERVFVAGDQVEYQGKVFRAKWWTQGDEPQEDPDQPYSHPWLYLGKAKPQTN